jgi:hypothetical protein
MIRRACGVLLLVSISISVSCGGGDDGGGLDANLVAITAPGSGAPLTMFAFGTVAAGSSATQMFAITNEGGTDSGALTVVTSDPFSIPSSSCELSLQPAGSCLVTIVFAPTANTSFAEALTVAGSGVSVSVALTGSGGPLTGLAPSP